jgi:hypothetical protein
MRAPYGTWRSPVRAADLARSAVSLSHIQVASGAPHWVESRPTEGGRYVIVTRGANGSSVERTPSGFNARTRVHEYGGRPYVLGSRGEIYFSNFADQRLYLQRPQEAPVALTPDGYRYADLELVPSAAPCLVGVREDHTGAGEPSNAIVALHLDTHAADH